MKFLIILLFISCAAPESPPPGGAAYDPDLDGWKSASWSPFTVNDTITGFAYGNGRYVAVSASGVIAYSDNGDIWKRAELSPDNITININAVCFADGLFIAVADNGIYVRSSDGASWILDRLIASATGGFSEEESIRGITWGNGVFAAAGDGAKIFYSNDGSVWRAGPNTGYPPHVHLNDIAFEPVDERFYAVGNDGRWGYINSSVPGTWLNLPDPRPIVSEITKITTGYLNSKIYFGFLYYHYEGEYNRWVNRALIAEYDDLFNFPNISDSELYQFHNEPFLFGNNHMNALALGGDYFVAAGENGMIGYLPAAADTDRYWRALSFKEFRDSDITALAACNGRFFIGNNTGKIGYSK